MPTTGPDWARNKVRVNALSLVRLLVLRTLELEENRPGGEGQANAEGRRILPVEINRLTRPLHRV